MRPPSENLRSSASTFHSISVGGRLVGLLKKISYSIFNRRNCVSRTASSSSVVTGVSKDSVVSRGRGGEVPVGHRRAWYESKSGSAVSDQPSVKNLTSGIAALQEKGNRDGLLSRFCLADGCRLTAGLGLTSRNSTPSS